MARIVRLTESELVRLVKKVIREQEEQENKKPSDKACSTAFMRVIRKVEQELTDEEKDALQSVYDEEGKEGLDDVAKDVLMDSGSIMEQRRKKQTINPALISAFKKISNITLGVSVGFLGVVGFLACLEPYQMGPNVDLGPSGPKWIGDVLGYGILAAIPLSVLSAIGVKAADAYEEDEKKNNSRR